MILADRVLTERRSAIAASPSLSLDARGCQTDTRASPPNKGTVGVLKSFNESLEPDISAFLTNRGIEAIREHSPTGRPRLLCLNSTIAREFRYRQIPFLRAEDFRILGFAPYKLARSGEITKIVPNHSSGKR